MIMTELKKTVKKRSLTKRVVIIISSFFLLAFLICMAVSVYKGWTLLKPVKKGINVTPSDYGINYQDIDILSEDGKTKLSGWVLEPKGKTKMTIIFSHGYGENRIEEGMPFLSLAKELLDSGFRIITFDFRNSGESRGDMTTIGIKEKLDLLGVINWANNKFEDPIGLLGVSMGAATALLAGAESSNVIAVVADSPFSDLHEYLKENMPKWSHLPDFPFTPMILNSIPLLMNIDINDSSPISVLDKLSTRPVLFIHNIGDDLIPYTESEKMVRKHPDHFSMWLTDGEGHVESYSQNSEEYVRRVNEFFESALKTR